MSATFNSFKEHFFVQILLAIVFLTSVFIVCALQLILYVSVKFWSTRLFRKLNYYLMYITYSQVTFLVEWWSNSEYDLFTDPQYLKNHFGKEHAILLGNHGKEIDSLITWACFDHLGILANVKVFMKSTLAYMPFYGLNLILGDNIFLNRNWEKDKKKLDTKLQNLAEYPDPMLLCIIPEGTRLSEEKLQLSQKFARENGLPVLKHILLPRTKGFVEIVKNMRGKIPAIYDGTVVMLPDSEENAKFKKLFMGKKISFKIMIKRYPIDELPEDEKELVNWLYQRYQEKDKHLGNVLSSGEFEPKEKSASTEEMKEFHKNFQYVKFPKSKSSLLSILLFSVIIFGSLLAYLIVILFRKNYFQLAIIFATIYAASAGLEKVIGISSQESKNGKT